jgi:cell division protein FtsB
MSILELLEPGTAGAGTAPDRATGPARQSRPSIAVVPDAPARASRLPFVLLVLLVLGVGLVGLLLLNTNLQQGSFQIHDLEKRTAALEKRQGELEQKVAAAQAPENLAKQARRDGMVPNPDPGFLKLSDASVSGDPKPAPKPVEKSKAAKQPTQQETPKPGQSQPTNKPTTQQGTN